MLHVLQHLPSKVGWRMKPDGCPSPAPNRFTQLLQTISQIRSCYLSLTVMVQQIFLGGLFGEGNYLEEGKSGQNVSLLISKSWRQRVGAGHAVGLQQHRTVLVLSTGQKRLQLHSMELSIWLGDRHSCFCNPQ